MDSVYIYHHLGLGDHIIANGMVRTLIEGVENPFLFCKPRNFKNVKYMYSDLKNLKFILMEDDQIKNFIRFNPSNNYKIIGHEAENYRIDRDQSPIDYIFYDIARVSLENKWSNFFIPRNKQLEDNAFKILNLDPEEDYVFIHDAPGRIISKLDSKFRIIKPDNENIGIFEFMGIIEKAKEVHCINSSFYCLIDCAQLKKENIFLHTYTNPGNPNLLGTYKLKWKIIE